ncbi:RDD family protein [Trinickia sp. YCB016]
MRYAGFWKRFAARLIDTIVLVLIGGIVGVAIAFVMIGGGVADQVGILKGLADLCGILFSWIYFAAMESSSKQGTLGKLALGIKVTDLEGRRISFGRASGRYFAMIISALILLIGYFMAAFTKKKQALHDMMAGCLVVNK